MIIVKYDSEEEAEQIKAEKIAEGYTLVEIRNITEGNFLGFQEPGWQPPQYPKPIEEQIDVLIQDNNLLKAQNNALSERADFIEDVIAEMAAQVYQ